MIRFPNRLPTSLPRLRLRPGGIALAAALALGIATALVPGCAKRPEAPAWSNPFDPSGPDQGDPFQVDARVMPGGIEVLWHVPNNPGIAHFQVLHSTDGRTYEIANRDPIGKDKMNWPHTLDSPSPPVFNGTNWYKVRAVDAAGNFSGISREVAAAKFLGPYLEIDGGVNTTPTRYVALMVRTQVGDSLELADNREFTASVRRAAVAGEPDTITGYDLGTASGPNVVKHVWMRVKVGSLWSASVHDSVRTAFQPNLVLATAAATVASRRVSVKWEKVGVVQTQLIAGADSAAAHAALPGAPVVSPDSLSGIEAYYTGTLLTTEASRQWIYGRFVGDFGYAWVDTTHAKPDDLSDAGFALARGALLTAEDPVQLGSHAVATQMRFGESVDLSAVPWRAYADTILFTLSPGPGLKVVYGEFANDWHTAAAVDSITVVGGKRAAAR